MKKLVLTSIALAASAPQAAPAQSAPSFQQQFDGATANAQAGKCEEAVSGFEALEARGLNAGGIVAAAIAVRKGQCLDKLQRKEEAMAALSAGLPGLRRAGENFVGEANDATLSLAGIYIELLDYDSAAQLLTDALPAFTSPKDRVAALIELTKATTFDKGPTASAYAAEAVAITDGIPEMSKGYKAAIYTLYGRALLNQGKLSNAETQMRIALELQGGLTKRTSLDQAATRSDLALVNTLQHDLPRAYGYLEMTGAGQIDESPFPIATDMSPPACGAETGLSPQDSAVVEFAIADDGSVGGVAPIYTTGGRRIALAFARAVSDWSWNPAQLGKIPIFYRVLIRVELRCSQAGQNHPNIGTPLTQRFYAWLSEFAEMDWLIPEIKARAAANLRERLAGAERADDRRQQLAALSLLTNNETLPPSDRRQFADRAIALSEELKAPAEVANVLRIFRSYILDEREPWSKTLTLRWSELLSRADMQQDALASDTLRLLLATRPRFASARENASQLLEQVANDDRLSEHHPIRQIAWLQLAADVAAKGDYALAQSHFARTGLTEQQCALLDMTPIMRKTGASSRHYPEQAAYRHFEGWVQTEYDINADGTTASQRAVISYPPFIFSDAAVGIAKDARYESSYRPGTGKACSANRQRVAFHLPKIAP